ncbi:MAG: hypothetical protein WBV21_05220, partial [Desulfobacterales bacterium]
VYHFYFRKGPFPDGIQFMPIHGFTEATGRFPIRKCAIFCKFKEISDIARRRTTVRRTSDFAD